MFGWLFGSAVIKEGTINSMWHEAAKPEQLLSLVPVPIYRGAEPEKWMIEFKYKDKSRVVAVSKECYDRYKVGDHIGFDN